jgi:hypothetical protein
VHLREQRAQAQRPSAAYIRSLYNHRQTTPQQPSAAGTRFDKMTGAYSYIIHHIK